MHLGQQQQQPSAALDLGLLCAASCALEHNLCCCDIRHLSSTSDWSSGVFCCPIPTSVLPPQSFSQARLCMLQVHRHQWSCLCSCWSRQQILIIGHCSTGRFELRNCTFAASMRHGGCTLFLFLFNLGIGFDPRCEEFLHPCHRSWILLSLWSQPGWLHQVHLDTACLSRAASFALLSELLYSLPFLLS